MFSFSSDAKARVTLQKRTLIDDGYGGESATWTDLDTVWAVLNVQSGRTYQLGDLPQSTQNATAWIRFHSQVEEANPENYRVVYKGRRAEVNSIAAFDAERTTFGRAYMRLTLIFDAPTRG